MSLYLYIIIIYKKRRRRAGRAGRCLPTVPGRRGMLGGLRRRCCRCGSYRPDGLRHMCGSLAAAGPLRRAAERSPTLGAHVAPARCCPCWPCCVLSRCARAATSARPYCRPSRSATLTAPRPPSAGIVSPAGRIAAAVVRCGPLSRYAYYDCNNYIDLLYILYLQSCIIRHDY